MTKFFLPNWMLFLVMGGRGESLIDIKFDSLLKFDI